MYICLCNGFTDRQVRGICADGGSAGEVFRSLGTPRCGKCIPIVKEIARAAQPTLTVEQPYA